MFLSAQPEVAAWYSSATLVHLVRQDTPLFHYLCHGLFFSILLVLADNFQKKNRCSLQRAKFAIRFHESSLVQGFLDIIEVWNISCTLWELLEIYPFSLEYFFSNYYSQNIPINKMPVCASSMSCVDPASSDQIGSNGPENRSSANDLYLPRNYFLKLFYLITGALTSPARAILHPLIHRYYQSYP